MCDLCRLSHPGHGTKQSSKGAGVEEQVLSRGAVSGSFRALCQPPDNCQQRERGSRGWQNLSLTDRWAPSHHCSIVAGRRAGKLRCMWGGRRKSQDEGDGQKQTMKGERENQQKSKRAKKKIQIRRVRQVGERQRPRENLRHKKKRRERALSQSTITSLALGIVWGLVRGVEAPEPTVYM